MRMTKPAVNFKLLKDGAAELILGNHPPDSPANHLFRFILEEVLKSFAFQPARISRMRIINLILQLFSGDIDFTSRRARYFRKDRKAIR